MEKLHDTFFIYYPSVGVFSVLNEKYPWAIYISNKYDEKIITASGSLLSVIQPHPYSIQKILD